MDYVQYNITLARYSNSLEGTAYLKCMQTSKT